MAGPVDIRGIAELTDRVTPVLRKISAGMRLVAGEQTFNRLGAQAKAVSAAYQGIGPALENVGQKVRGIAAGLTAAGVTFAAVQGAAMAFAGFTVKAFADAGGGLADLSAKTGMTAERLQELRYAAMLTGVEAESMGKGMTKLNKTLAEAQAGKNKLASEYFRRMGINIRGAKIEDILPKISEAFKKNENAAQRTAAAMALFGKAGADMIPMLIGGQKGLADTAKEARDLGLIISEADVASADNLGDNLDKLGRAVKGVGIQIGAKLAPVIGPLIEDMLEWLKVNKDWLATSIADGLRDMITALKKIDFKRIYEDVKEFMKSTDDLVQKIGGWKVVFASLGVLIGMDLVVSVAGLTAAFYKLGASMVALGLTGVITMFKALHVAITAVATVIGGLATAGLLLPLALGGAILVGIIKNWDEFSAAVEKAWGGLKKIFEGNIMEGFSDIFTANVDAVKAVLKGLVQAVGDLIGVDLMKKIEEGTAKLSELLEAYLLKPFRDTVAAIKALLSGISLPSFNLFPGAPETPPAPGSNSFRPPAAGPMPLPSAAPQRTGSLLGGYEPGSLLRSAAQAGMIQPAAAPQRSEGTVTVRFANAPPGTQADTSSNGNLFNLRQGDMGYAMQGAG